MLSFVNLLRSKERKIGGGGDPNQYSCAIDTAIKKKSLTSLRQSATPHSMLPKHGNSVSDSDRNMNCVFRFSFFFERRVFESPSSFHPHTHILLSSSPVLYTSIPDSLRPCLPVPLYIIIRLPVLIERGLIEAYLAYPPAFVQVSPSEIAVIDAISPSPAFGLIGHDTVRTLHRCHG